MTVNWICETCGTQYDASAEPPIRCDICSDPRQYVGVKGQRWITLEDLRTKYQTKFEGQEPGLWSMQVVPHFGIGQRAFLLQTPAGNILWDCVALLNDQLATAIAELGGIQAIAISHPHYYTTMVEWKRWFAEAPIYLHRDDQRWVMRSDADIEYWDGDTLDLLGEATLIRCGGHFEGGCVLHWPGGANGRGTLLSGDIIQVVPDRRWVSFMWSYPNLIPLNATSVKRIVKAVEPFAFDRIYGAFPNMTVETDGSAAVRRSAERYVNAIAGDLE